MNTARKWQIMSSNLGSLSWVQNVKGRWETQKAREIVFFKKLNQCKKIHIWSNIPKFFKKQDLILHLCGSASLTSSLSQPLWILSLFKIWYLLIDFSHWFFKKKYCIKTSFILITACFGHLLKHCAQGKCPTCLTLIPALLVSPSLGNCVKLSQMLWLRGSVFSCLSGDDHFPPISQGCGEKLRRYE